MRSNKFLEVVRVYRENQLALRYSFSRVVPSPLEMAQSEVRSALMDASIAEYLAGRARLSTDTTTTTPNMNYNKSIESALASLTTEMDKSTGKYTFTSAPQDNDDISEAIRGGDVQLVRSLVMERRESHSVT
jgi:hypothetical protein